MNYQIKVIDCEASDLDSALNEPASEGWQLVSCWPTGPAVRAVFQRQAGSAPPADRPLPKTKATPPVPVKAQPSPGASIPTDDTLLDAVIAACKNEPQKVSKQGKPLPPGIGLAKLGKGWGVPAVQVRAKLEALGVKEKADKTSKDHSHAGFFIWLYGDFVNISEAKRKPPTRP